LHFDVIARNKEGGRFDLYVSVVHNFKIGKEFHCKQKKLKLKKQIDDPRVFLDSLESCLAHLRNYGYKFSATDESAIEEYLPVLLNIDIEFSRRLMRVLASPQITNCPRVNTRSRKLSISIYDWDTSESYLLNGEMCISKNADLAPEPLEFTFDGEILNKEGESYPVSLYGETWETFLESAEFCDWGTIPRDSLIQKIRTDFKLESYLNWLDQIKPTVPTIRHQWYYSDAAKKLRQNGLSLSGCDNQSAPNFNSHVRFELFRGNYENVKLFLELGTPVDPEWWKYIVDSKNIEAMKQLHMYFGVNMSFRKYRAYKIYDQDTPLSLCVKSGWQEGIDVLLNAGAFTEGIVARQIGNRSEYHDFTQIKKGQNVSPSKIEVPH
jgi:hypothetical protein